MSRPPAFHRFVLIAFLALLASAPARAQLSGTATLVSDDRFRGISRSDGRPNLRLALAYDADDGWYAGGSVARTELWPDHWRPQWQAYAGRSLRLSPTLAWEAGVSGVHFAGGRDYDYAELYAGLLGEQLQGRVYVSPDYFGRNARSAYLELEGRWPLGRDDLHLLAHAGLLAVSRSASDERKQRADALLGAAWSVERAELRLAWSGAGRGGPYPAAYGARRSGVTLGLSLHF